MINANSFSFNLSLHCINFFRRKKTFALPPAIRSEKYCIHGSSQVENLNHKPLSARNCLVVALTIFPGHYVLPQGTTGVHNIFLGGRYVVFLLSGLFLSVDVLPKEISCERATEKSFVRNENKRRTISRLGKTRGPQRFGRANLEGSVAEILSDRIPQQDGRNSRTQTSMNTGPD